LIDSVVLLMNMLAIRRRHFIQCFQASSSELHLGGEAGLQQSLRNAWWRDSDILSIDLIKMTENITRGGS